jgi:AraC-like DNA-binding protein
MTGDFGQHLEIALRHATTSTVVTPIPRVELHIGTSQTDATPCLYRSMVCFLLQGGKRVSINDSVLNYDTAHYMVSALELPIMGQVVGADQRRPYVAVSLALTPPLLAELAASMPPVRGNEPANIGVSISPMTAEVRDALQRLLMLLDQPADIPVLAPMLERELLYRLLQGPQGRLLRQIAQPEGPIARIARVVAWIRNNQNRRLRVESLCEAGGMSRASLHRHFLTITGVTPLQYQKHLRLQDARRLLLAGDHNVSGVAFAVGYESVSQFSREYLRQFGSPPAVDARRLREQLHQSFIR